MPHCPPFPYRLSNLPDLPAACNAVAGTPASSEERQAWVSALPDLGFELLFERQGVGLDTHLESQSKKLEQKARYGKVLSRSARPPQESLMQWWRHPAGALTTVSLFRFSPGGEWLFNSAHLHARIDHGFGIRDSMAMNAFHPSAERVEIILTNVEFFEEWKKIRVMAANGQLVPFDHWPELNVNQGLLDASFQVVSLKGIKAEDVATPMARFKVAQGLRARTAVALARPWRDQIIAADIPPAEKSLWLNTLAAEVLALRVCLLPGDANKTLPKWILATDRATQPPDVSAKMSRNAVSSAINRALSACGMASGDPLSKQERATTAKWAAALSDRRHPGCAPDAFRAAMTAEIPRLGAKFHHALFECVDLPGLATKARWWQSQQDPADLAAWCRTPDADGISLPMRWIDAWLRVPNVRVNARRHAHRRSHAAGALENLMELCPPGQWCWASPTRSVWDPGLAQTINLPMDDDLLGANAVATRTLADWLAAHDLRLPSHLVVPGCSSAVDMLVPGLLAAAIDRAIAADVLHVSGTGTERAKLLDPIVASLQHAQLRHQTPQSPPQPARTPRL